MANKANVDGSGTGETVKTRELPASEIVPGKPPTVPEAEPRLPDIPPALISVYVPSPKVGGRGEGEVREILTVEVQRPARGDQIAVRDGVQVEVRQRTGVQRQAAGNRERVDAVVALDDMAASGGHEGAGHGSGAESVLRFREQILHQERRH